MKKHIRRLSFFTLLSLFLLVSVVPSASAASVEHSVKWDFSFLNGNLTSSEPFWLNSPQTVTLGWEGKSGANVGISIKDLNDSGKEVAYVAATAYGGGISVNLPASRYRIDVMAMNGWVSSSGTAFVRY